MPPAAKPFITVVSGLPRSGTSLMMQMLHAGGLPALTDQARTADEDNPRGYFEFERVKQVKNDKAWIEDAQGRVVKMVHLLLLDLPLDRQYRIVMMRRDLHEVVQSQATMLQRSGKAGAALAAEQLMRIYEQQMATVLKWLSDRPDHFKTLEVHYGQLIADPAGHATKLAAFLDGGMDVQAMAAAVDPNLYRNRRA